MNTRLIRVAGVSDGDETGTQQTSHQPFTGHMRHSLGRSHRFRVDLESPITVQKKVAYTQGSATSCTKLFH